MFGRFNITHIYIYTYIYMYVHIYVDIYEYIFAPYLRSDSGIAVLSTGPRSGKIGICARSDLAKASGIQVEGRLSKLIPLHSRFGGSVELKGLALPCFA